ncbi:hypothetical protein LCGC14_1278890 [marine sediment metagenome]|uniref:Uncharacterized protein n=1 Tax=marine sediment metagenome TaxID=412755 RepID=A0A0F9LH42_9ZZZZ
MREQTTISLIKVFTTKFEELISKFEDSRELKYEYKDEVNLEKPFITSFWTEKEIKVGIWRNSISKWLEVTPVIKNLELESLKVIFIQSAKHEYGHCISFESFYLDFPEEMQEIISKNKITFMKEYDDLYEKTEFNKIDKSLININLQELKRKFLEFIADYLVYEKIEKSYPKLCLKMFYDTIELYLKTIPLLESKENITLSQHLLMLFLNMHVFYIFKNNWKKMTKLFEKFNKTVLLKFLFIFHQISEKIFQKHKVYTEMKKDVIEFGRFLNNIDYPSIFFTENQDVIQPIFDYFQKFIKS